MAEGSTHSLLLHWRHVSGELYIHDDFNLALFEWHEVENYHIECYCQDWHPDCLVLLLASHLL